MKVAIFLKPAGSHPRRFDKVDQVRIRDGMIELVGTSNDKIGVLAGFNLESFMYWAQEEEGKELDAAMERMNTAVDRIQSGISKV